ncbi:hypothetical protein CEXT_496811, partial [Caerostris extrusa]
MGIGETKQQPVLESKAIAMHLLAEECALAKGEMEMLPHLITPSGFIHSNSLSFRDGAGKSHEMKQNRASRVHAEDGQG